jgi:ABC-type glycerol-3-phosphate transport system permease component
MIYSSFKPTAKIRTEIFALPTTLFLENYDFSRISEVNGITIGIYLKNSVIVTIGSLALIAIVSILAAYALAFSRIPGKKVIVILSVALLGIPVHSVVLPLYHYIDRLGLLNNYLGLILPYTAFWAPFSVLLLQSYFRSFPRELRDAATIDGCGHLALLLRVVLPVFKGAVTSVTIINFIAVWNEFLLGTTIMTKNASKTLPVGVSTLRGQYGVEWGPFFAVLVITIIVPIVFYALFHQNLMKGQTEGAIKG